jgi:hypothetical protein
MTSVPFNPAVATRFIAYYNDSIQFQSTLAYLKHPPPSYQQPGVDLAGGLGQLQLAINEGRFENQYQFESALARLIHAAHDTHLYLDAGVLAVFSFASPRDLVSISLDGISEPKVYFASKILTAPSRDFHKLIRAKATYKTATLHGLQTARSGVNQRHRFNNISGAVRCQQFLWDSGATRRLESTYAKPCPGYSGAI